jgi:hypothetical protein
MSYFKNIDRWGNEINNSDALDFNPVPVNYTPSASGNTANLNSFVIDPNGDMYFIDKDGDSFKVNTSSPLDVLGNVQPTPTLTGNTANLNTVFKDANGDTWVVDVKGDAIKVSSAPVPETVTNITNALSAGNKIATYTNEAGTAVDIFETVTSVTDFSISGSTVTLKYKDETGTENTKSFTLPAASSETVTTITNALSSGNKIGTYTNESGAVVDIYETITSIGTILFDAVTGVLTIPYTDEAGVVNNKTITLPTALNVLTTVQPTPTATGNTTNLNSTFKDAAGNTWIVDGNGDAIQAGNAAFKNLNEFHVDPNGNDTTGNGSQEKPFLTIAKALTLVGQGDQIIVHAGVYTENLTISVPNVAIVGAQSEYNSLTQINGSVTVSSSGTSVKISDIGIKNIIHTGTSPLYLENTTVYTTLDSSSAAYVEIKNTSIQDGAITKSAGTLLIEQSKIDTVNITGTNTVATIRNSYQDANSTITYGAGTIYNVQNVQGGEIVINAAAIPLETAALGGGLTAEMAKEAETADFMKLGMLRPDTEATPTKVVTWDEVTGRLEVSSLSSINTGAPVTVGTNPPTGTSIEGAIHLVTDDGTPTGTVLEQYIYDVESGVWIEMQRNAQDTVKFGTAPPTSNGEWDGEEYFVTSTGNSAGTVTEQWIWDKQSSTWVKRPSENVSFGTIAPTSVNGAREGDEYFITSTGTSTGTITAQYIYDATSASWILRPSGGSSANWVSETTDPTLTGNTGTLPRFQWNTTNDSKWYVDSNGIALLIEGAATGCGTVYFDSTDPSTATIFDSANPPVTNNDALKNLDCAVYIGTDGSVWTSDGTNYKTKSYSFSVQQLDTDTIATAGQTAFTLAKSPIGAVYIYRNGVRLSAAAITWVGKNVTYIPAGNGGKTMDAGDRVEFEYSAY